MIEFQMPSLGADMEAGTLVEWRKKPGDTVKRGDIIAEVETQKGLIEIEVFDEGVIGELLIKEGTKIPVGTVMALIKTNGEDQETQKEAAPEKIIPQIQPTEEKTIKKPTGEKSEKKHIKASPLAKRIAADNNIDLSRIQGTGEDGAITKEDVDNAMVQKEKTAKPEGKTPLQLEAIRLAVAAAVSKSNKEIPHYYLEKKIDMTKALAWLREANSKRTIQKRLLPAALIIKATAKSLVDFPNLNAIWDNGLQLKEEINIGFVVSLRGGGVIVPAIRNANLKSVDEIMEALNDIIPRARAMKLRSSDLTDTTISITSLGEGGADMVFGVIYPPQVAIVGFGGSSQQPVVENGMLGIRPIFTATLAGDHRATDGLTGSDFLSALNNNLQNPELL
ncbi:dihydrolipoamide acetyltransferase family protein [Flavobacterium limnophilum]|uniref:dihydrolipoamide acetyltransferase family protein n=1 Tax=Flavobacterium limnophilum TaxID=3003262 RepID=UPI0024825186|nr:dihydrolipoamide acetyltransferase family protein [Flavobacterium limnophilum]